jgi:antitoxin component of MazEF toxin-antitoxin module
MVEKIKKENLLKIPNLVLKRVGLEPGDYVEVTDDGYKIIITPKVPEEAFTDEEWTKLEKLAKEKKGRAFKTGAALLKHLDKLSQK